jgi:hypothetical protein
VFREGAAEIEFTSRARKTGPARVFLLDAGRSRNVDDFERRITIRHRLTMTAGQDGRADFPDEDPRHTTGSMKASFD